MQLLKMTWKNHRRMIRATAVLLLALCVLFLAGQWYKLYKDRQAQTQEWFDAQGEKIQAFVKLGRELYDAKVALPGISQVVEKMQSSFDSTKTRTFENADYVTSSDEELPYDGRISIYYDEDGDQICAYGDTAILGFRYPVYIGGYDQAMPYAFPYMKLLPQNTGYYCCIDPDRSKYEAFDDVATELFQTGYTWAEKDGYTFKKCRLDFYRAGEQTVIISRKTPEAFSYYAKNLALMGLVSLGISSVALLVLLGWLCILDKRVTKIEEDPEVSVKAVRRHRELGESLLVLVDGAVNSLGPKTEFEEIRSVIDQVKESDPVPKQGPGVNARRYMHLHSTAAQILVPVLAVIAVLIVSSFIHFKIVERRLDDVVDQRLLTDQSFASVDYSYLLLWGYEGQVNVMREFEDGYYFSRVNLEEQAHSMGWIFKGTTALESLTAEDLAKLTNGDVYLEGDIDNSGALIVDKNGTPQLVGGSKITFDVSGHTINFVREEGASSTVFNLSLVGENNTELMEYGFCTDRPEPVEDEELFSVPVFCDKNGDFLSFFQGNLFYTSMIKCGGSPAMDERYTEPGMDQISMSCGLSSIAHNSGMTSSVSVFSEWLEKLLNLQTAGQTEGWMDDYRFHRIDIESSRSLPAIRGQIAFIEGEEAWRDWKHGVIENAIVLFAALVVMEIVAVLIRRKDQAASETPEQDEYAIPAEEKAMWTPVLSAIENAEKSLGHIGYLEDIRKKING